MWNEYGIADGYIFESEVGTQVVNCKVNYRLATSLETLEQEIRLADGF